MNQKQLNAAQKNIWFKMLENVSSVGEITAFLTLPKSTDIAQIQISCQQMIKKIDIFELQITDQYELITAKPFFVFEELKDFSHQQDKFLKWKNIWSEKKLFAYQKFLYDIQLCINDEGNPIIGLKIHPLIGDYQTLNYCFEFLMSLLREEKPKSNDFPISFITYLNQIKQVKELHNVPQEQMAYWQAKLSQYEGEVVFKSNLEQNDATSVSHLTKILSVEETDAITTYCNANKIDLYEFYLGMLLFLKSSFAIWENKTDMALGVMTGRVRENEQSMIGPLTTISPFLTNMQQDEKIIEYFDRIKNEVATLQQYADGSDIKAILANSDFTQDEQLIDIACISYKETLSGSYIDYQIKSNATTYPLTVQLITGSTQIKINYVFQKTIFDEHKIDRIHELLHFYIKQITHEEAKQLKDILLVTTDEIETLNKDNHFEEKEKMHIIEAFQKHVALKPDYIILKDGQKTFTYHALDKYSNQMAAYLQSAGVKVGQVVGTTLSGYQGIITILGILKAGAVYLPLDANYPVKRIDFILKDCRAAYVVVSEAGQLPSTTTNFSEISFDQAMAETKSFGQVTIKPTDLAYIIYTSGSTGNPKGVKVRHENVLNLVSGIQAAFQFTETDTLQHFASMSFSASIVEIFSGLLNGVRVLAINQEVKQDPVRLQDLWDQEKVTWGIIPPAYVPSLDSKRPTTLRYMVTGGEEASWAFSENWHRKTQYVNIYGQSETTVNSTVWFYNENEDRQKSVPIGKPLLNVKCSVMKNGQECGIGMPGELWISGNSISSGYINNEVLTKKQFVIHPVTKEIAYRTGDLVEWRESGMLGFISRNDFQVNIRGFRIELGEINHCMSRQAHVEKAVSVVQEDECGKQIVAYVVPKEDFDMQLFKAALRKELPDYMVPHHIMMLDEIPLTVSRKIDRKKLPKVMLKSAGEVVDHDNDLVGLLCAIYQTVLNVSEVTSSDDFYSLGGDSIKAIQIVSSLREKGITANNQDILSMATVQTVADNLARKNPRFTSNGAPNKMIDRKLPTTPIQRFFFGQNLLAPDHFNVSIVLQATGKIERKWVEAAYQQVMVNHPQLQLLFKNTQEQSLSNESKFLLDEYTYEDSKSEDFLTYFTKITNQIQEAFNLDETLMSHLAVMHNQKASCLFICIHQLVADQYSLKIIAEELDYYYQQLANEGIISKKLNITDQFVRTIENINRSDTNHLAQEKNYWREITQKIKERQADSQYEVSNQIKKEQVILNETLSHKLLMLVQKQKVLKTEDILLTSLLTAVETSEEKLAVMLSQDLRTMLTTELEEHQQVGWHENLFPAVFNVSKQLLSTLFNVRQMLEDTPRQGKGYLAYYNIQHVQNQYTDLPQILFRYREHSNQNMAYFEIDETLQSKNISAANLSSFPVTFDIQVKDGTVQLTIIYDEAYWDEEEVQSFLENAQENLGQLVAECENLSEDLLPIMSNAPINWLSAKLDKVLGVTQEAGKVVEKVYPLTPMQENLLFNTLADKTDHYIMQVSAESNRLLEITRVKKVLQKLVEIYEPLRSNILYQRLSMPLQVQFEQQEIPFVVDDISNLADQSQKNAVIADVKQTAKRSFDLEHEPLIRVNLVQIGQANSLLVWTIHHILADGWCLPILQKTFLQLYQAEDIEYTAKEIKENKASYEDYIVTLFKQDLVTELNYWQTALSGYEPEPLLIPEKKVTGQVEAQYVRLQHSLPKEVTEKIETVAKRYHATQGVIFETIFGLLLQIYSMTEDIVFGKVVAGRHHDLKGIDKMLGLFINTIPVRVKTNQSLTIAQMFKNLTRQTKHSSENQTISLAEINTIYPNAVQVLMNIDVFQNQDLTEQDLSLNIVEAVRETNYDLSLSIIQGSDVVVEMLYNTSKYEETVIEALLTRYAYLLSQAIENPDVPISEFQQALPTEVKRITEDFNQEAMVDEVAQQNIVTVFAEVVEKYPNKIAIMDDEKQVTFQTLDLLSNQVAYMLKEKAVAKGDIVVSMMPRGYEAVAVFLGILKAGGIYLPIDPTNPDDRIRYILSDSQTKFVVTTEVLARQKADCLAIVDAKILDITEAENYHSKSLANQSEANDTAYIIYTSGSTGKPKGGLVGHASAVNVTKIVTEDLGLTEIDRIQQFASLAFDASVLEILSGLLNGMTLVIIPEKYKLYPDKIIDIWNQTKVTYAILPPVLAIEMNVARVETLKYLMTAGEESNWQLVDKWAPQVTYVNGYGPTEATVWSTYWVNDETADRRQPVPIGRPVHNVQVYIMQGTQLCGVGVMGEICVAGISVGQGYLNRPTLSAEKFVDNPLNPQEKMYRTGDYGRYRSDGQIEFMGRKDHQVKIRGNRVELGEIASHLRKQKDVQDAVVLAEQHQNEKVLVAYLASNQKLDMEASKKELRQVVPSYMIPSFMMQLDKIPQNANGKVDKTKLPDPFLKKTKAKQKAYSLNEKSVVSNESNHYIQKILPLFKEVLDLKDVDITDDFFNLGGHSLKAARLVNLLSAELNQTISIQTLFDNPSVLYLANWLMKNEKNRQVVHDSSLDISEKTSDSATVKLAVNDSLLNKKKAMVEWLDTDSSQKRLFALQALSPQSIAYNMAASYQINGNVDLSRLSQAVQTATERHDAFKTNFSLIDGEVKMRIKTHIETHLEKIKTTELNQISEQLFKPFDLVHDQLVRFYLIQTSEQVYFRIDMHHIIGDAISCEVLIQEIMALYRGEQLPTLPMTYRDLLAYEADQEQQEKAFVYWQKLYKQVPAPLDLPVDFKRKSRNDFEGSQLSLDCSGTLKNQILNYCAQHQATPYMFFLAAFAMLLNQVTKQSDMVIASPMNSRIYEGSEEVVGMFVNTVPLRAALKQNMVFDDLLNDMKNQTLNGFIYQNCPLEKIINYTDTNKDFTRNPLFDVVLSFNVYDQDKLDGGDLELDRCNIEPPFAKFELTLDILQLTDHFNLRWEYKKNLFKPETIQNFHDRFIMIVEKIVQSNDGSDQVISS